ncbi:hypothetical protein GCM10010446_08410 [Streptomyces enissocaesilis]|uniref:Uncharacterized protein n=1 Tax=Streptomyces enissocaesilis TaxID=332589 RepID=A0ABN3WSQ9_9ACTN
MTPSLPARPPRRCRQRRAYQKGARTGPSPADRARPGSRHHLVVPGLLRLACGTICSRGLRTSFRSGQPADAAGFPAGWGFRQAGESVDAEVFLEEGFEAAAVDE